jgi:hypothetical protein
MKFRPVHLLALPVMAMAPLQFAASRYQPTKCGAEANPVFINQGGRQYEVTRVIDVPQPNPLALWHWLSGFASLVAPPIVVALNAMPGMRSGNNDSREEDRSFATSVIGQGLDPFAVDSDDEEEEASDPLQADDLDDFPITSPSSAVVTTSDPSTADWMSAIIAVAQRRAASPPASIASDDQDDPLDDLDLDLDLAKPLS